MIKRKEAKHPMRRFQQTFQEAGLIYEALTCLEDWELFIRIAKEYEIVFLEEPLVVVHLERGGVTSNLAGWYKARCYMIAKHKEALQQSGKFDEVVETFLSSAESVEIFEAAVQLLQHYLNRM